MYFPGLIRDEKKCVFRIFVDFMCHRHPLPLHRVLFDLASCDCTSLPHRLNPFLSLNYSCFFQLHLPPVSFPNIPPFSRFLSARSLPWGIHLSLLTWPLKSLPGQQACLVRITVAGCRKKS